MITVEDILRLDEKIAVLHGESGVSRRVAYIDVVEIPEGMHWTNANDFIITTGYCFASDEALLELLVRTLIRRGCAGLGIKIGRYIDSIPDRIANIAEENAFPIIRIPMHFSYRDISRPLLNTLTTSDPSEYSFGSVDNLYSAIIHGDLSNEQDIRESAAKFGIALSSLRYILIARSTFPLARDKLAELCSAIDGAADVQCCCLPAERQNSALIICRICSPEIFNAEYAATVQQIFAAIRDTLGQHDTVITMSAPCQSLLDINQAAFHTSALLNLGMRLYPEQKEFLFSDHYLDLFLNDNQNHYVLNHLCNTLITPLAEADARQNTELIPTLMALCKSSFSITETAKFLFLHRNTVYNRIKQIEAIIGSISDFDTKQLLTLACKHYHILKADSNALEHGN